MKPNQTAIKLSLNKAVVTVLSQDKMMSHHGKNGLNNNFATETKPPPQTYDTCLSCPPTGGTVDTTGFTSW